MKQIKGTKQSVKRTESTLAAKQHVRELTRDQLAANVSGGGQDEGWAQVMK